MAKTHLDPVRRPNLIGIGAAKSGTTWLSSVLSAHPDIYMPEQKELNALHYDDFPQRLSEYEDYFANVKSEQIRCDFSVRYLPSKNAPSAAAHYIPDTKILMSVRNPVDQIQSHYWHLLRQNFHQARPVTSRPTLFEALERYPGLLLEPALYGSHIRRWLDVFPRERFFFVRQADLLNQAESVLSAICQFLEIKEFDFKKTVGTVSSSDARTGVQPRVGVLGQMYPLVYTSVTRGPLRWAKSILGVRRTDAIKRALKLRQVSENIFFRQGYTKLQDDERLRLLEIVEQDLRDFSNLTGFDVSSWVSRERS